MKTNFETIDIILNDELLNEKELNNALTHEQINSTIDSIISNQSDRAYYKQTNSLNVLFQQEKVKTSEYPVELFQIDVSQQVMAEVSIVDITQVKSSQVQHQNNVIPFIPKSLVNQLSKLNSKSFLAIAASLLLFSISINSLFFIESENKFSSSIASTNFAQEQKLIQQDLLEQEKNLQETLLKHRLLQQGFFPSQLTPATLSSVYGTQEQENSNSYTPVNDDLSLPIYLYKSDQSINSAPQIYRASLQ